MSGHAVGMNEDRGGSLALGDKSLLAVGSQLRPLEAQAGVPSGEARAVTEAARSPLLIGYEQKSYLRESIRVCGEGAHHADREDVAPLHVDRARSDQSAVGPFERTMLVVRHHRVEVTEEQQTSLACAADRGEQVRREPR